MGPDELDAAADLLDTLAAETASGLDEVVAHHRPDVWQGARADRFGLELSRQRARLRATAGQLTADARALRARAGLIRATLPTPP